MNDIVKHLIAGNDKFISSGMYDGDVSEKVRKENKSGQKPYAVVITCSDSRVIPEVIFSEGIGKIFVVRTAGNVFNDSEHASVDYAVKHLHVSNIIVLGHTNCGAINAAISSEFDGITGVITKEIKKAIGDEIDPNMACSKNVKYTVEKIKEIYGGTSVKVYGAVYNIETGKVDFITETE